MVRSTWKATERRVAAALGGKRTPLSGGNSLLTTGDVVHPSLYVEVKHRARFALLTLMRRIQKEAVSEGKLPVLVLQEGGRKGRYYMVTEADFIAVFDPVPKEVKVAHVLSEARKGSGGHQCHAYRCETKTAPSMFMCKHHWFMVPKRLRDLVWKLYVPGQETSKEASPEYIAAARKAIRAVRELEDDDEN